jgi:lipopolysaccharide transport system ATP-binding protein
MSSDVAVRVAGIGKQYHLGSARAGYSTLRDRLQELASSSLRALVRRGRREAERPSFWALQDVSFEVRQGDVVGIIGRNGAGKSTLLKILSRITEPTTGEAEIRGRVGSLLEVGTGFHPELTGRENVFLNGAILGMTRTEIKRHFDEIVAFAEVEKFIDTPVKHYSSGMYMRLAFAVAAHLEPEILIVDEVLAVGDAEFQAKCLGKMGQAAKSGRTVLFVSHNITAISTLCNKGILLESGLLSVAGEIGGVVTKYLSKHSETADKKWQGNVGNDHIRLKHTTVESLDLDDAFHTAAAIRVTAVIQVMHPVTGLVFGFRLFSSSGTELAYTLYDDKEHSTPPSVPAGEYRATWTIPKNTLAEGSYRIGFALGIHNQSIAVLNTAGTLKFQLENASGLGRRFSAKGNSGHESLMRPDWAEGFSEC